MANPNESTWKNDDAQRLRSFVSDNPKFLTELRKAMPRVGVCDTTEAAANGGQAVEGYMQCLDNIEKLLDHEGGGLSPAIPYFQPKPEEARQL